MVTDIRLAKTAGYQGLEVRMSKLERYLHVGYRAEDLLPSLGRLEIPMVGAIEGVEPRDPERRRRLRAEVEQLCAAAKVLKCPALQVVALDGLEPMSWKEQLPIIARGTAELADIAARHGVRLGFEPLVVSSPVNSLRRAHELIDATERKNIGINVDTFHLWAAKETTPDEVAKMDPRLITSVHIGEATQPKGSIWTDDDRAAFPGEGIVPLKEWVAAVRATGYDGWWSVEMWSPRHWEWDPEIVALETKQRAETLLAS
jgi:sugar phosphate isomerase/epimerase